jgi:AhpD family alkylhydroperoxidase
VQARLNPTAATAPDAVKGINLLYKATRQAGIPELTLELVHLRASQINGCSFCVDAAVKGLTKQDETPERLGTVAAWREAPYFTDAERAALELTEAATRLSDRPNPVTDEIWGRAAEHYTEEQLSALVLWIGVTNLFNRINASLKVPAGSVTW